MPTPVDNLLTRYAAIATELATVQSTAVSYRSDAGSSRKGQLESYRLQLYQEMKAIIDTLKSLGYTIADDGTLTTTVFADESQAL